MTHHAPIRPPRPAAAPSLDSQPQSQPPPPPPLHGGDPHPGARWTAPRMAAFLRHLSATHSVSAAARLAGMSRQSAYRLRSRLKGQAFDLAWDVAFHHSYDNLAHAALERALNGVEVPVFFNGEQVGSYRKFDERLTVALLAMSTARGNVPMLGRHPQDAERHGERFDALVAEVAAGAGGDAPVADQGPAPASEAGRLWSAGLSPMSDAELTAQLRRLREEEGG